MWLASVSRHHPRHGIVPTTEWNRTTLREAHGRLVDLLRGVGDTSMERFFRMCVTACFHRALTADEAAGLSAAWKAAPAVDLAGAPVEVIAQHGVPESCLVSTSPCASPTKRLLMPKQPGQRWPLWLPQDCGACASCLARAALRPTG